MRAGPGRTDYVWFGAWAGEMRQMRGFFAALRMTDVRLLVSLTRAVAGEAEAGELPAGGGWEEVSVGGADVGGGGDA